MSLLRTIESRIGQLIEGTFGRAFRSHVQPVELARRLVSEMDSHRQNTLRKAYVPNLYDVYLSPADHEQFHGAESALCGELAEYLAEHARREGYALSRRPRVVLHADADLQLGAFGINATMEAPAPTSATGAPETESTPVGSTVVLPAATAAPHVRAPVNIPTAGYALRTPSGTIPLSKSPLQIGRGRSNDLVLQDADVSRNHAELRERDGIWVIVDLDSTNGLTVNGVKALEQPLHPGDRLVLGTSELLFEAAGGEAL